MIKIHNWIDIDCRLNADIEDDYLIITKDICQRNLRDYNISPNHNFSFQVEYDDFKNDLQCSFNKNISELKNQLAIDIPRLNMFLNGNQINNCSEISHVDLNDHILYLTQASLGLPTEILSECNPSRVICEIDQNKDRSALYIIVDDTIFINKKMRSVEFTEYGDLDTIDTYDITLLINVKTHTVTLKIKVVDDPDQ